MNFLTIILRKRFRKRLQRLAAFYNFDGRIQPDDGFACGPCSPNAKGSKARENF